MFEEELKGRVGELDVIVHVESRGEKWKIKVLTGGIKCKVLKIRVQSIPKVFEIVFSHVREMSLKITLSLILLTILVSSAYILIIHRGKGLILDVINLDGLSVDERIMVISIQGIVNRDKPRLYVLWRNPLLNFNPSKHWLEYYKDKGWINGWREISLDKLLDKYKDFIKGIVVYDPKLPDTLNLAVSLSGVYDLAIASPRLAEQLVKKGFKIVFDLRGKFRDKFEVYSWELRELKGKCNSSLIFLYPTDTPTHIAARSCLIDYAVKYRAYCVSLRVDIPKEAKMLSMFLEALKPLGILLGYPHTPKLEVPTVIFASKHGIRCVLATHDAPNYSIHCMMGEIRSYKLDYKQIAKVENKVYIAFFISDLALNSMHNLYYGFWVDKARGKIPLAWWLDPIVESFCPGIIQYYYETRTENDIFFAANTYGRITPSDFKYLDKLLTLCNEKLKQYDLRVLGFSDSKFNEEVFEKYARKLSYALGFGYGYVPRGKYPNYWVTEGKPFIGLYKAFTITSGRQLYDTVKHIVEGFKERPLFLAFYILISEKNSLSSIVHYAMKLQEEYPNEIEIVRVDELLSAIKMYVEKAKKSEVKEVKEGVKHRGKLNIKVAILYENITHDRLLNRTIEDLLRILNETHAQFIFRAFWRWSPCPNTLSEVPEKLRGIIYIRGYYYEHLEEVIREIKKRRPDIIICGAIPAQKLGRVDWNPIERKIIRYPETWNMALDPGKWGLNISKVKLQYYFAKSHLWIPENMTEEEYDPSRVPAYFPDITNPEFQKLLLSWAYRLIDAGVDAIWIDMLFAQAKMLGKIAKNMSHSAVKESFEAAYKIILKIKEYGARKGKYIYVGSWANIYFPHPEVLDFITISPSSREVLNMKIDVEKWDERLKLLKEKYPNATIMVFLDWAATTRTPLGVFSQRLKPEEQAKFLELMDQYFRSRGVIPVYPVHGGYMGYDAEIKAYGKYPFYDALAPEFNIYDKIVELAERAYREQ